MLKQRLRVIVAVEAGLAGPGSDGGSHLIIIILAWGAQPPAVDVDKETSLVL